LLDPEVEPHATGRQDLHAWASLEQLIEQRRSGGDLLEVIKNEQEVAILQGIGQGPGRGLAWDLWHFEGAGNGRHDKDGVANRGEWNEGNPVAQLVPHLSRDRQGEARLAHATRPGQG
jgi:hypothetical protein